MGVIELAWNALDADADEVRVSFSEGALGGIDEVRISDNGTGMTGDFAVKVFTGLGGSWKASAGRSEAGRPLHGRSGEGRWKAFGVGPRVRWETVAEVGDQRWLTLIEGSVDQIDGFDISDPVETDRPRGTTVVIFGFLENPKGLQGDSVVGKVLTTFATVVEANDISLTYDGKRIDPSGVKQHSEEYPLEVPADAPPAKLQVIEWAIEVERLLYLCDGAGTPLFEIHPNIQAPGFEFTAYLSWDGFAENPSILPVAERWSPEIAPVIEAARDALRDHFRERQPEVTRRVIEEWKEEDAYPFISEPSGLIESAERDLFDIVALTASKAVNATNDRKSRRLSLGLIKAALETDPGALHEILGKVLELPPDRMEELRRLLQQTTLGAIVTAARRITNRLDFLKALELLVFDRGVKAELKERSQLHRILANETWVFGEEYALTASDESLNTVLTRHIKLLGRERMADDGEAVDLDGHRRIVDLMLARSLEQAKNRLEHVVIELKAPTVKLGSDELTQIKNYAYAVIADQRYDKVDVEWDFMLVGNSLDEFAEHERNQNDRENGLLWHEGKSRIWVKTWSEVIDACEHRLKFVRNALDYAPHQDDGLAYLREAHSKLLPESLATTAAPVAN